MTIYLYVAANKAVRAGMLILLLHNINSLKCKFLTALHVYETDEELQTFYCLLT
jgi:hypothetical protein